MSINIMKKLLLILILLPLSCSAFTVNKVKELPQACINAQQAGSEVLGCTYISDKDERTMYIKNNIGYPFLEKRVMWHELSHYLMHGKVSFKEFEKEVDVHNSVEEVAAWDFADWMFYKSEKQIDILPHDKLFRKVCNKACVKEAINMIII